MTPAAQCSAETDLVRQLRAGDGAAFEVLVRAHTARLLALARRMLRNEEDARDAVQEAFLLAFRSLPGFQGQARLSTWLHRIGVNACLMRLRTRRRKPEAPIDDLLPRFLEDGHHAVHPRFWSAGETALEAGETRDFVRACIDRLPETYRTVLLLRDIEELDGEETARALGISRNTVKVRLHRARQALRTLLEPRFARGQA